MILRDAIDVSLDNLRQSRLRTFLTTLGVAIGVGSIVGMLAVAIGLQDNLYSQLLRTGFFRRITVWAQGAGGRGEQQQPPRQIDENAILAIRQIPGVKLITREARIPVRLQAGEKTVNTQMTGVILDDADEAVFTEIKQGRFITSSEAREIILSSQTAKTLGFIDPAAAVGQMIRVRVRVDRSGAGFGFPVPEIPVPEPFELKVAGVVERERALFGDMNARLVYAPQAVIEEQVQFFQTRVPMIMAMVTNWAPLQVRLNDARDVDRVERKSRGWDSAPSRCPASSPTCGGRSSWWICCWR